MLGIKKIIFGDNASNKQRESSKTRLDNIEESIADLKEKINELYESEKETRQSMDNVKELLASKRYSLVMSIDKNLDPFVNQLNGIVVERVKLGNELRMLENEKEQLEKSTKEEVKEDGQQTDNSLLQVYPEQIIESPKKYVGKFFKDIQAYEKEYKLDKRSDNKLNIQDGEGEEQYNNLLRL